MLLLCCLDFSLKEEILYFQNSGVGFDDVDGDIFQIFLGRGQAFVADVFLQMSRINAAFELMGDKGVS